MLVSEVTKSKLGGIVYFSVTDWDQSSSAHVRNYPHNFGIDSASTASGSGDPASSHDLWSAHGSVARANCYTGYGFEDSLEIHVRALAPH